MAPPYLLTQRHQFSGSTTNIRKINDYDGYCAEHQIMKNSTLSEFLGNEYPRPAASDEP